MLEVGQALVVVGDDLSVHRDHAVLAAKGIVTVSDRLPDLLANQRRVQVDGLLVQRRFARVHWARGSRMQLDGLLASATGEHGFYTPGLDSDSSSRR